VREDPECANKIYVSDAVKHSGKGCAEQRQAKEADRDKPLIAMSVRRDGIGDVRIFIWAQ
jgi:hypothetical protein